MIRRAAWLLASVVATSLVAIAVGAWGSETCEGYPTGVTYDLAVVLGGGANRAGLPRDASPGRVEAAVALYNAGIVVHLHMTGAGPEHGASEARRMARFAQTLGVPDGAMMVEQASHSTLQNALFSRRMVGPDGSFILVTDGFHLSRAWASFAWMGLAPDGVCRSRQSDLGPGRLARTLLREVLAYPFNLARALGWSALAALGVDTRTTDRLLH